MDVLVTLRALTIAAVLVLICDPARATVSGHSDPPGDLVREIHAVTPRGTMIDNRYLSASLTDDIFFSAPAGLDLLYGDLSAGDAAAVQIVTLNVTGQSGNQPMHATVLAFLSNEHPFGRRYSLIVEEGEWRVRDICIMPEGLNLSDTQGWRARSLDRDLGRNPGPRAAC